MKFAALQTNSSAGGAGGRVGQQQADQAVRNLLLASRDVAKMLGAVQGRKVLLFLSSGFVMNPDLQSDYQATLDALNKANVGVYPVGAAGLAPSTAGGGTSGPTRAAPVPRLAAGGLENTKLLIANGVQLIPSASNHFARGSQPAVYLELYDPLLKEGTVQVGILFKILENASSRQVYSSDTVPLERFVRPGNPLVAASFKLPAEKLPAGRYRMEVWGRDSAGHVSESRTGYFTIE